ncbi:ABC transporter permease [Bradyrhizobium sp. IC3069]|uniref:ABC transporter permease n=1 Tax=unclassified Bradyrhizobium TaxID=2631580 RepID=UPI001CD20CFE|nr:MULTISPECIES: ABC transporter permease [unclassified Bradyrhizobium]MCA1365768.1 ABC transporter permease [Bradyrhizobium sp. IC4059]MCA1523462.1 ABC transporter permease [Bradyrhizobium sp. IC3069]
MIPIALICPALAILLGVFGLPALLLFLNSLNEPAFSLSNYEAFFNHGANVHVLIQTVEVSIVATVICVIIGYPTAYLIAGASKRLRMALLVFVVIPYLTSFLVRTCAWIVIVGDSGLINSLLLDLGLISSPAPLIYNRLAVYIGMVHIMLPMVLPLVSVMLGIEPTSGRTIAPSRTLSPSGTCSCRLACLGSAAARCWSSYSVLVST